MMDLKSLIYSPLQLNRETLDLRRVYGVHLVPAAQFGFRLANDADGVP